MASADRGWHRWAKPSGHTQLDVVEWPQHNVVLVLDLASGAHMVNDFWRFFDDIAAPQLAHRAATMQATFEYLDKLTDPLVIIETGSVRLADNWAGDGQSTILFDRYATIRPGCQVYTVDNSVVSSQECSKLVSKRVQVYCEDSVVCLHRLARQTWPEGTSFLFYLDSFDVDFNNPYPSAAHHLKEMVAISPLLRNDSLVVVDDSPAQPRGKGFLIAEYAQAVGAKTLFHAYQLGLTGFIAR